MTENTDTLVSGQVLAGWLGVSHRQVQTLAKDGVIQAADANRYALRASVLAYCLSMRKRAQARGQSSSVDADTRYKAARAERMELQTRQLAGGLMPLETVMDAWGRIASTFRQRMLGMPSKLAPTFANVLGPERGRQAAELVREEADRILLEISRAPVYGDGEPIPGIAQSGPAGDDGRGKAAAEADRQ